MFPKACTPLEAAATTQAAGSTGRDEQIVEVMLWTAQKRRNDPLSHTSSNSWCSAVSVSAHTCPWICHSHVHTKIVSLSFTVSDIRNRKKAQKEMSHHGHWCRYWNWSRTSEGLAFSYLYMFNSHVSAGELLSRRLCVAAAVQQCVAPNMNYVNMTGEHPRWIQREKDTAATGMAQNGKLTLIVKKWFGCDDYICYHFVGFLDSLFL